MWFSTSKNSIGRETRGPAGSRVYYERLSGQWSLLVGTGKYRVIVFPIVLKMVSDRGFLNLHAVPGSSSVECRYNMLRDCRRHSRRLEKQRLASPPPPTLPTPPTFPQAGAGRTSFLSTHNLRCIWSLVANVKQALGTLLTTSSWASVMPGLPPFY